MTSIRGYGNLMNRIQDNTVYTDEKGVPLVPEVGMGCTQNMWSDRHAFTITEVVRTKDGKVKHFIATEDDWERTDNNGMSESQSYTFKPNPNGRSIMVRQDKRGQWCEVSVTRYNDGRVTTRTSSTTVNLGVRSKYDDPSF